MSTNRDFNRIAAAWLAEGPSELADRVLDAALDEVHLTHQRRRLPVPWRLPTLSTPLRLAAAIAIIAVVGYAGLTFFNPSGGIGSMPSPTPPPTASPSTGPTATPGPTPIDTADWTTYTSERYGFTIAHPTDWSEQPADHDWTIDEVAWQSSAIESFVGGPDGNQIRISAWSIAVEPGTSLEQWFAAYCFTNTYPCTGLQDNSTGITMDGHPGLLVDNPSEFEVYTLIDNRMYVLASWRSSTEADAARLLPAFLSTVRLLPGGPVEPSASPSASPSPS